ncbi:MAG: N-acetylneuraminate synthase [Magnetococcales bacterium]|nr:N-acetylneuraminate synthase [Magnetococcales bacterium]
MSGSAVFILAEAGVNHNGDLDLARRLIDKAVEAGVDAVKFQSFNPQQLVAHHAPKANYQKGSGGAGESQRRMLEKLALSEADHHHLLDHCRQQGITFLSTPFDEISLNFLVKQLGLTTLKLSSGAVTHGPLLLAAAQSGAKIILSTGLCNLGEVEQALMVLAYGLTPPNNPPGTAAFEQAYCRPDGREALLEKVTLLHCTTQYPTPVEAVNLRAMDTLHNAFGLPVGYSDHTAGISIPLAAVARGASVIEKHFTLDTTLPGPDHKASLEPEQLKAMVGGIREVEAALGDGFKRLMASERENRSVVRTSLTALQDIAQGELFTSDNLGVKRPGTGIAPRHYWSWLGRRSSRAFVQDEAIE